MLLEIMRKYTIVSINVEYIIFMLLIPHAIGKKIMEKLSKMRPYLQPKAKTIFKHLYRKLET